MIVIESKESKCKICLGRLRWCIDCKTFHHLGDTDHIDRRGFDILGNPDEDYYSRLYRY